MELRLEIRNSLWLLVTTFVTYIVAETTNQALFMWLGIILSIWLFLSLYWVGIRLIAYFSQPRYEEQESTSVEDTMSLVENSLSAPHEPVLPTHQSQPLQQTTSE